ncbi:hypothetical protein FOA43_001673 [Brettanomyces nanus]|uniref:Uncharacterized protein n=1 Tax=Eeniella nana TaxID=13502 RepID=A0A875RYW0_EENNA|nr:uncharacterized protein FOA43_001673 [Brettanomyces nanus]QPG74346.1 hypothetical protein FOA43_001673 [Brettanomyces nanus]
MAKVSTEFGMSSVDDSSIKRVTKDGGLESITLRSDLAVRYVFLNESLLDAFNLIKRDENEESSIGLKETLVTEKIANEEKYLSDWAERLKQDVESAGKNDISQRGEEKNRKLDEELKYLDKAIESLKQEFLNPTDEDLRRRNDGILKDYTKRFDRVVYEIRDRVKQDDDSEKDDEAESDDSDSDSDSQEYAGTTFHRLSDPVRIGGVRYEKAENRKGDADTSENSDMEQNAESTQQQHPNGASFASM